MYENETERAISSLKAIKTIFDAIHDGHIRVVYRKGFDLERRTYGTDMIFNMIFYYVYEGLGLPASLFPPFPPPKKKTRKNRK